MTPAERIALYNDHPNFGQRFPDSKLYLGEASGRVYGMWFFGNNYKNVSNLYGTYPPSYLPRITTLFPDKSPVLHLFAGDVPNSPDYVKFDINPDRNPDVVGDSEKLSEYFPENSFGVIYADPPYSISDAERYETSMIKRNVVVKEVFKVLQPGGFLIWMDQVLPQYRKVDWNLWGSLGLVRSTWCVA